MNKKILWPIILVVVVVLVFAVRFNQQPNNQGTIKIGIITDLTGPAAYWGESTRAGAGLSAKELEGRGYKVQLIYEDYKLDAATAVSAAQKLVNVDQVDAIYAEFNPAAISVGSFMKGKKLLYMYDAAVVSPLENSPYAYKTYLDYEKGCAAVANKFKEQGIQKIGVLKVNLEFGELCLRGIKEVYAQNAFVEGYNLGDTDFRTQMLKLNSENIGAIINVGFEGDTYNTLKTIRDFNYKILYGTVDDTLTDKVKNQFSNELKGAWSFGFKDVNKNFSAQLSNITSGQKLSTEYGAAIAYTHIKQMAQALRSCSGDLSCITNSIDHSPPDNTIGFTGFKNHIANLEMQLKNY